jgi:hypothetical protein
VTDNGEKLAGLDDAVAFDNGNKVAFTVTTTTGNRMRVHCTLSEIGDIFSYLGSLAKAAGEMRSVPAPSIPQGHDYLAPVPAQGIGFQAGRSLDETLLVVRLSGFDVAFAVPSSELARMADDLVHIARTLSTGSEKPPN